MTCCLRVVITVENVPIDDFGALRPLVLWAAAASALQCLSLGEVDRSSSFGVFLGVLKPLTLIVTLKPTKYESHEVVNLQVHIVSIFLTPEVEALFSQVIILDGKDNTIK